MSRVVHGVMGRCRLCTPTLPRMRTNQCGGGMRVRHDSATGGTGAVRSSILHVSRIPRQSMYQLTRAQTIHSLVHLTCNAKQLKQQANLRIRPANQTLKINDIAGIQVASIRQEQRGWDACGRESLRELHHPR